MGVEQGAGTAALSDYPLENSNNLLCNISTSVAISTAVIGFITRLLDKHILIIYSF